MGDLAEYLSEHNVDFDTSEYVVSEANRLYSLRRDVRAADRARPEGARDRAEVRGGENKTFNLRRPIVFGDPSKGMNGRHYHALSQVALPTPHMEMAGHRGQHATNRDQLTAEIAAGSITIEANKQAIEAS